MISIVDYGVGNLASVANMFRKIGAEAEVTGDPDRISRATKLLLPGVGAFDHAMERLTGTALRRLLDQKVLVDKVPVLGICLGMQLLGRGSEEGNLPGLNWIPSFAYRFPANGLKVPHMGWNVANVQTTNPLVVHAGEEHRYYFVHSYYVKADSPANSMLRSDYGISFDSGIQSGNIFGVQFHPEKSHRFGMELLRNFCKI